MWKFSDLLIGDMFNTLPARWVKISPTQAICVMSGAIQLGSIRTIPDETEIILLWSCLLKNSNEETQ